MQLTVSDRLLVQPHIFVDISVGEGCIRPAPSPQPTFPERKADNQAANQPVLSPPGGQPSGDEGEWTEDPRYPGCKFNIRFVGETDLDKVYEARMDDYSQRLSADIVRFMSNPVR